MEENLKRIIDKLEKSLQQSAEDNDIRFQLAFSYSFLDPENTPDRQLKTLEAPLEGVAAVLQLLERYPDIYYFYEPDYLRLYLEHYYGKGYEQLLLQSVRHNPMAYTLHLLHRVINDKDNTHSADARELLAHVAQNSQYPQAIRQDAAERIAHIEEQERPLVVKPANYQIISLDEAITRFDLEKIYYRDGKHDSLADTVDPALKVIMFEGNTEFVDDLKERTAPVSDFQKLIYSDGVKRRSRIIIVNGNLNACKVDVRNISCLFVFGNMECEKISFYESRPAFIQGNLTASQAILGVADTDDAGYEEERGRNCACVQGQVYAPRVQTWYMRLGHLNWTPGSGKEFAEDEVLNHNDHFKDAIWQ